MAKSIGSNILQCLTCKDSPEMNHDDFMKHLKDAHGIEPGEKGTRQMVMHVDGRTFYKSSFKWTMKGVEFMQYTENSREKDDPMRY